MVISVCFTSASALALAAAMEEESREASLSWAATRSRRSRASLSTKRLSAWRVWFALPGVACSKLERGVGGSAWEGRAQLVLWPVDDALPAESFHAPPWRGLARASRRGGRRHGARRGDHTCPLPTAQWFRGLG